MRGPDDLPILATRIAGEADCLVAGDKDLLALAGKDPVMRPSDFCARHAP